MLASIAIDHLQETLCDKTIPVVYIYCDYRKQQEQTPINLMVSILKQLLQHQMSVPDRVMQSYHRHINSETRRNLEEVDDLIKVSLADISHAYVVVDALDELSMSSQVRQILLKKLRSLQKAHSLNLMITTRPIPQSDYELQSALYLDIRANNGRYQEIPLWAYE